MSLAYEKDAREWLMHVDVVGCNTPVHRWRVVVVDYVGHEIGGIDWTTALDAHNVLCQWLAAGLRNLRLVGEP